MANIEETSEPLQRLWTWKGTEFIVTEIYSIKNLKDKMFSFSFEQYSKWPEYQSNDKLGKCEKRTDGRKEER